GDANNMGHNWYRMDPDHTMAFGVLQNDHESAERKYFDYGSQWSLYSARPGTDQSMTMFLYPVLGNGWDAIGKSLAFTNGDKFRPLPGFKTWALHMHSHFTERARELLKGQPDAKLLDFVAVKQAGINILSPVEDPYGGLGWLARRAPERHGDLAPF